MRLIVVAAAYAAAVHAGLLLVPEGGSGASLVWPAAAVGVAAMYFWGFHMWPAMVLAFFALLVSRDLAPSLAIGVAVGNALESAAAAYLLRRMRFSPMFSRMRDSMGFILAAFVAPFGGAAFITACAYLFGVSGVFSTGLFLGLWIGHAVSLLSFGPFALRWLARPLFTKTPKELIEGIAIFVPLALISFLIYWTPYGSVGNISLIYIAVMFYIWASLRAGPRGISMALALTAALAAAGIIFGWGPVSASPNIAQSLFGIQVLFGTISIIFLLFTSITEERKEAVITLERHVGQLEVALDRIQSEDQAKADFIAILAHELRNPLSPILSGLEILKARQEGPQDVVRMMGAHVHTMARLLDDLLDITRITQKKFRLERSPTELRTIIEHALEMVRPAIAERRHELQVTLPQSPVWLNADPVRLTQVFANILGNASKYTDPGGKIRLIAERESTPAGEQAVVRISDNGSGIPQERLPRVFDAFGGSERAPHKATGLRIGLSLAKRMTELHHGTIEAKSDGPGRGSEFTVRLPVTPVQMPLEAPASIRKRSRYTRGAIETLGAGGTSMLVCDDNEGAAQALGTLLEHNGHTVALAYSGAEAIARAQEAGPRVALLDIGLPDMDGYALARRLRQEHPAIVLVALTGYGQSEDRQKSKDAGFDEHLVKPVSIVDVERVLSELGIRQ